MSRAEAHLGVSPNAPSQDEPTLTLEQVIRMRKIFNQNCRANNGTKITERYSFKGCFDKSNDDDIQEELFQKSPIV